MPKNERMGILSNMIARFRGAESGPVAVKLNGKMLTVDRGTFGALNAMADAGMGIRKDPSDASIGTGTFTQGIPAFWFARSIEGGGGAESLADPYENSAWVQRAIKKVAGPIASVDVKFSAIKTGAPKRTRKKSIPCWTARGLVHKSADDFIDLPAVDAWLKQPMAGLSYSDFVEASIGWMKLRECFWLMSDEALVPFPEATETFPSIIIARPNMMRPQIDDGKLTGWVYTPSYGKSYGLNPEQVIQLRYWNSQNDFRGFGEYPAAHIAAEADYLAGKFSRNLMANNGDLGGIIIAKSGVPTDGQREQMINDLRMKRAAQLRGELKYLFFTGDIELQDPKITSVDAAFIGQRLENRHEIAIALGLPPSMFDVKAAFSIGSASDYYQLIMDTCIPDGRKFCGALEILIYRLTGQRVEVSLNWDGHPVMQAVLRERMDSMDKLWAKGMPMRDISDYLGMNLPEFDGDDVGFVAINVTPIDQAAEPPPPPAEDPALSENPNPNLTTDHTDITDGKKPDNTPEPVKAVIKLLKSQSVQAVKSVAKIPSVEKVAKSHRTKLWTQHQRLRSGVMNQYAGKVSKVLNEYRGKVLHKLEHSGAGSKSLGAQVDKGLIDLIFNAHEFGNSLITALNPVAQNAVTTATEQLHEEIGRPDDPWKMAPPKVKELIKSRDKSLMGCGQTVRDQINTALKDGYDAGDSTEELADRVRGVFNNLAKSEARRIAATETTIVFNTARHDAMKGAGIKRKIWLSSGLDNVREDHQDASDYYADNPIPLDEPFEVGEDKLMYPGDPSGSPEEIINCRCVQIAAMEDLDDE